MFPNHIGVAGIYANAGVHCMVYGKDRLINLAVLSIKYEMWRSIFVNSLKNT